MAHHKRGKPKNARAGCLMCKCYKMNSAKGRWATVQEKKAETKLDEGLEEVYTDEEDGTVRLGICGCGDENC